jgi:hypothetical protein
MQTASPGPKSRVSPSIVVFRYPLPEGRRPSDAAVDAGMTRQAMGYLLGQLEELGYLTARTTRPTGDPSGST